MVCRDDVMLFSHAPPMTQSPGAVAACLLLLLLCAPVPMMPVEVLNVFCTVSRFPIPNPKS